MFKKIFIYVVALLSLCGTGCVQRQEPGTEKNPLVFALVPGKDTLALEKDGKILRKYLEGQTGLHIKVLVPHSYIAVVEALGVGRADFCLMNSFGYLLANEKFGARAELITLSQGVDQYYGAIFSHAEGLSNIKQIHQKSFAFVDPSSSSGYLLPQDLFVREKIQPKELIFAGRHDAVITMVYQKRVSAGATFYSKPENGHIMDARRLVKAQFPDVEQKVKILQLTGPVPNDPIVFRKDLSPKIVEKLVKAFLAASKNVEARAALKSIYNISGFRVATDGDYDPLRDIVKRLGKTSKDLVQ